ncbi:MAG: hypothetical protein ACKORK_01035, partial [Gemmatimonadota bacterium]
AGCAHRDHRWARRLESHALRAAGGTMSGKVNAVTVRWDGAHRFDGGRPESAATIRLDASGETGPSPVYALLCARARFTGVDVVDIL